MVRPYEGRGAVRAVNDNEVNSLSYVTQDLWREIESRLITWAEMIEDRREKYRKAYLEKATA